MWNKPQPGLLWGWLGDGDAAPNRTQSPVFLNLMQLDPTSDCGTWQRQRVFGQTVELLLVTLATFFPSSPPANHIAATGIHQNPEVYLNMYPQGPTISFKLYSCAAWKIQHSTTCAVIESIEIFIAQEGCNGTGTFCGGGGVREPSTLVKSRREKSHSIQFSLVFIFNTFRCVCSLFKRWVPSHFIEIQEYYIERDDEPILCSP